MSEYYCINCNSLLEYDCHLDNFNCLNKRCEIILYFFNEFNYYIIDFLYNKNVFDFIQGEENLFILNKTNNFEYSFNIKISYNKEKILNSLDNLIFA